ncbi:EAL domain-containing protein [Hyphomonas sp.]|uniref:putative bifunctional diguanylate cyclase/phosphodiesterase n=1 Tax=Hyphomonas sp. TaxID=87 RepID=UPI0025B7F1BE|nr:EAL domain-containing protein [Hyphomonas sp.]
MKNGAMMENWFTLARRDLGPATMSSEHAAYIRGQQLHTFRQLLPFGLTASALNALVLIAYLSYHAPSPALLFWGTLMSCLALLGARSVLRVMRHQTPPRPRTQQELYRPIAESAALGLAWSICPVLFLPATQGFDLAIVLWVCAGMMTGAAYVLSTLPAAAIPFVSALSFGMALGLLRSGTGTEQLALLALLGILTIVMIRTTSWNYTNHVRSWLQAAKLTDQTVQLEKKQAVISLLLNEFEEAASDCLWETNADHRLMRPSKHLAERSGFTVEQLDNQPLIDFFDATDPEAAADLARLREALGNYQPVHNVSLATRRGSTRQWWRISAKPVFDEMGRFDGFRGVAADVTEKRRADQQIAHLAHFDSLTGVPKQEKLREALQAAASSFGTTVHPFAVHCLDLDRFKTINDVHGHAAGDAVLKSVAGRIQSVLGPQDIVARFGGDEFVILQQGISGPGEAMALALTIQDLMSVAVDTDTALVQSTVSIGIAMFPDHSVDATDLMRFADLALMAAKEGGRDTARLFEPGMNEMVHLRMRMESDLRSALANNEFELNYQPIVDAQTGQISGYETLIRWMHPKRGNVCPAEFVPILEQTGLIWQVGNWIIREALREAATWDPSLKVSINLSPMQVKNRSLLTIVTHTMAQTGIDPRRVDFEITETALFDATEDSLSVMHALRDLGSSISLDDFGTGYSSLSYLRTFPFNKIKIDKSFVDQMETSEECAAIIQAVLGLARRLGMRTTAEGVETAEQARRLIDEGCTELQGYHFGRPGLPADLEKAGLLKRAPASSGVAVRALPRLVAASLANAS